MTSAKDIFVAPVSAKDANEIVKKVHYSGSVVQNSMLHLGVFLNGRLEGAMQFGPSLDKRNCIGFVENTGWNGFLELNRMAFSDRLPRNSESRALGIAFRLIKKHYPHIEWVLSYSDGTQCGDGTIYRASGFDLIGIKQNKTILEFPDGQVVTDLSLKLSKPHQLRLLGGYYSGTDALRKARELGAKPKIGFQLRYIYFLNKEAKGRLTVPIIPFSRIDEVGATMYKGIAKRSKEHESEHPSDVDGATPI